MQLSKKARKAFRRYYRNRRNQKIVEWDKQTDLTLIHNSLTKNCVRMQASAGTFWLTWKTPRIQTTHSESNYWCCKVLARYCCGKWETVECRKPRRLKFQTP